MNSKIRIAGTVNDSIVDGPGLRFTIFTQGCPHHCPGCHNPQTHDMNGGDFISVEDLLEKIDQNPLLDGITISGGEPLLQPEPLKDLVCQVKKRGLNVFLYTGYLWEDILANSQWLALVEQVDTVVEGPFLQELKTLDLPYRGSSNQKIISVREVLRR